MRPTKIALAIVSAGALALTFAACSAVVNSGPAANNANSANNANNANRATVTNANSAPANNNASSQSGTAEIRSVDFLNYSYQTSGCAEDVGLPATVRVRDGRFSADSNFYNIIENRVVYGDVNANGREDALIQITCGSSAGTLRAFEIHAYEYQNGQARLLARLDSSVVQRDYNQHYHNGAEEWTVFALGENGVKAEDGQLIVEAWTDGSYASPENIATFRYRLRGNGFVLDGRPTRRRGSR